MLSYFLDDGAPPRPPLPSSGVDGLYGVGGRGQQQQQHHQQHQQQHHHGRSQHPADTTDDESEDVFLNAPTPSQGPIMVKKTNNASKLTFKISGYFPRIVNSDPQY